MNSEYISAIVLIVSFVIGLVVALSISISILKQQEERRKDKILRKKAKERKIRELEEEKKREEQLRIIQETYVSDEMPKDTLRQRLDKKKSSSWTEFESEADQTDEASLIEQRRKQEDGAYQYIKRKKEA